MQTKYTTEPWEAIGLQIYELSRAGCDTNRIICEMVTSDWDYSDPCPTHTEQGCNADRIVACVNACAGLEPSAIAGVIEAAKRLEDHLGLAEMPEPSHKGSCGPESMCDANCQEMAWASDRNERINKLRSALKALEVR